MFHSRLYRKLSLAAAVLGLFSVACWNQNANAAGGDTSKTTTATPAAVSPEGERLQLVTLPKGTHITTTVGQTLESDKNHWGDTFSARLVQPVKVDGKTVLPRGTPVTGRVLEAKKHELKVVLTSAVIHGVYCDLTTNARRPSDKDQPKIKGHKPKIDNSVLAAHTHLTFKLAKSVTIPVNKA